MDNYIINPMKRNIFSLTYKYWEEYFDSINEPIFRAKQICDWIYKKKIFDFSKMINISKDIRNKLSNEFYVSKPKILNIKTDNDKTTKFLFSLKDNHSIESVLIPDNNRLTLCISTQIGCPIGCKYCVTASLGYIRNLEIDEIIIQYIMCNEWANEHLKKSITNIVYMGMGEPLLNFHNVLNSLRIFTHENMISLSKRRITISTVGIIKYLKKLAKTPYIGSITISLGGATNNKREYLIPIARENTLNDIIYFCKKHRLPKRLRYTFAYVMIKDINDSDEDAHILSSILKGIPCKINLIPYNENSIIKKLKSPEPERVVRFQDILINNNYTVFVRKARGQNIDAACGMLRARYEAYKN